MLRVQELAKCEHNSELIRTCNQGYIICKLQMCTFFIAALEVNCRCVLNSHVKSGYILCCLHRLDSQSPSSILPLHVPQIAYHFQFLCLLKRSVCDMAHNNMT